MIEKDRNKSEQLDSVTEDDVVSNLLPDVFSGRQPPDLKDKIIVKLQLVKENTSTHNAAESSNADYDAALAFAENEIDRGYGFVVPPPIHPVVSQDTSLRVWIQRGSLLIAGLAASITAVVLFMPKDSDVAKPYTSTTEKKSRLVPEPANDASSMTASSDVPNANDPKIAQRIDSDSTVNDSAPIAQDVKTQNTKIANNIKSAPSPKSNAISATSMSDLEMVSVIDNQLKHLWVRVGLTPQSSVKTETWMERSSLAIVGRLPTAAEKEAFRTNKGEFRTADYVDKLLASDEFSKHWSELLAEHYLGRRVVGVRNQPVTQIAFVKWIGDSLSRGVFVGELERELISGPKSDFNDAGSWTRTDPAAYWISELLERSVVEQRESPELNSKKPIDPKNVGLVGVARHLMRISGNGPMVCSQCHETETRGDDLQGYLSKAKFNRGLDSFWAVPASLSGLSLDRSVPNVRALKIERPKQYFFEDVEGRMKLAMAGLPTPNSSKLPKQDLADWFRSSMEPRRAMVEVVWKEVFKQPLMPVFGLTSDEGNDERADLRDLLASQMQAGQKDLGKLVRWMVLSNAFRLDRHTIDSPWYLKASEGQVADVQKQMRLFASSSSTDTANIATGKIPLNQVASWMKSDHSYKQTNQALAQGATTTSSSNSGTKTNKPTYSDDQVRFLISTSKSYGILARFAEKLASSSMTWPMVVEHLYLTIDSRLPTRAEREDAEKLLNTIDQDRAKAVVMLINANCGSF